MELAVTQYLKEFSDQSQALNYLKETFGIEAKEHPDYPELCQLNYSQIESPKTHPIVRDCRGLILNKEKDWEVVAFPFRRFFNYGEGNVEKELDWQNAKVQDKVDGSLIIVYHYNDQWHIATRGNPKADSKVHDWDITFSDLFLSAIDQSLFYELDPSCTYLFEVCSPYNRVVVRHSECYVVTLAVFDRLTGKEYPKIDTLPNPVKEYSLTDIEDLLEMAKTLNPLDQEGYVVVDNKGNRCKIKSPKYVALHHLICNMSQRKMIELVRQGETDEILSYFPELKPEHDKITSKLESLVSEAQALWNSSKHLENKKDFALKVKDHPLAPVLFSLKDSKFKNVREGIASLSIKKMERLLE